MKKGEWGKGCVTVMIHRK